MSLKYAHSKKREVPGYCKKLIFPELSVKYSAPSFPLPHSHGNSGVLNTAGGVVHDQGEADEDMSVQKRLVLAGGSGLEGASGMVDNEAVSKTMEATGREFDIVVVFWHCLKLQCRFSIVPSYIMM